MTGLCPVCAGAGWWHRTTGKVLDNDVSRSFAGQDAFRCLFCKGEGRCVVARYAGYG